MGTKTGTFFTVYYVFCESKYMWMLTFHVVLGCQGLLFWDFLWFFFFSFFFSIQLTNPISGNASNAKWKKRGWPYAKIFLIGCISSSLDCFSITKKLRESFPARQTPHDNFLINEIGNMQFYRKLKYTCMQIWSNKIWYSHRPDLFVYTSSSLAFFLMQWVKSTVIFPSWPCFKFLCGQ